MLFHLRLDVVLISLTLGRDLDWVPFGNHIDITFKVAFGASRYVIGIGEEGPFVVELVIC